MLCSGSVGIASHRLDAVTTDVIRLTFSLAAKVGGQYVLCILRFVDCVNFVN